MLILSILVREKTPRVQVPQPPKRRGRPPKAKKGSQAEALAEIQEQIVVESSPIPAPPATLWGIQDGLQVDDYEAAVEVSAPASSWTPINAPSRQVALSRTIVNAVRERSRRQTKSVPTTPVTQTALPARVCVSSPIVPPVLKPTSGKVLKARSPPKGSVAQSMLSRFFGGLMGKKKDE